MKLQALTQELETLSTGIVDSNKTQVKLQKIKAEKAKDLDEFLAILVTFWDALKIILKIVMIFTGKKTDDWITNVITKGDKVFA